MGSDATDVVALDAVLLGSALRLGPLEIALLALVATGWSAFGAWGWRRCRCRSGGTTRLTVWQLLAGLGLVAAVLAQDALLFYAGSAVAGYASLGALLRIHGRAGSGPATVLLILLVVGDLMLFELLVYLYAQAESTGFSDLQAAYRRQGDGISFVWGLLVLTGASRFAPLLLVVPVLSPTGAWRPGAVSVLLCLAVTGGALPAVRLAGDPLASGGMLSVFLPMLVGALLLYAIAAACVAGRSGLRQATRAVALTATHVAAAATAVLARLAVWVQQWAPLWLALERRLCAWPVAVSAAAGLAVLLVIMFEG